MAGSHRRQSKPGAAGGAGGNRAALLSRTLGSLTGWRLLAADVQREMEAATAAGGRESQLAAGGQRGRGRSSCAVEPGLIMSDDDTEVGEACAWDGLGSGGGDGGEAWPAAPAQDVGSGRLAAEFEVLGELGRGAFGSALRARRRADGAAVCLKVVDARSVGAADRRMARDEVRVLSSLAHPNIVRFDLCFFEAGRQVICQELCECGDLDQLLRARCGVPLAQDEVMLTFVQVCLALQHVHAKGIIHRDVKSSNVFVSQHGIVKLGDFGISKVMAPGKSYAKTMVGTPYCLSPEVVEDKPYNSKTDCWSLGILLYELCALQRPFRGGSVSAIAVKILRGAYAPLPEQYSAEVHNLVAALLSRKPEQRPSVDEVLSYGFMRAAMQRYRDHVQHAVGSRKDSHFRSLDMFCLDGAAPAAARQRDSQLAGVGARQQHHAPRSSTALGPSRLSHAAGQGPRRQPGEEARLGGQPGPTQPPAPGSQTMVCVCVDAPPAARGADLASALASVLSQAAPASTIRQPLPAAGLVAGSCAPGSPAQAADCGGWQGGAPRQSAFCAVPHLLAAVGVASGGHGGHDKASNGLPLARYERYESAAGWSAKGPGPTSRPSSPRSMLFAERSLLDTTGTDALAAMTVSGSSDSDGAWGGEAVGPHSTPDHAAADAAVIARAADSMGDLVRRFPALVRQVEGLLQTRQQWQVAGEEGTEAEADLRQRRLDRRTAVQQCLEELVLPPPAFSSWSPGSA